MSDDDFTKVYRSLFSSTVWVGTPAHVKLAWIVILGEADGIGRVTTPIPGLAKLAEISVEQMEEAIQKFLSPDPYSRSPENEGRRLERLTPEDIFGGFRILNHPKYRAKRDAETRREQVREATARWRNKVKGSPMFTDVHGDQCEPIPSLSSSPSSCSGEVQEGDPVRQVFDHWAEKCWSQASERTPKFSDDRKRVIRARLRSYSVGDICEALTRASRSAYHCRAQNPDGKFYGDIDNLIGSDGKLEKWLASGEPAPAQNAKIDPDGLNDTQGW